MECNRYCKTMWINDGNRAYCKDHELAGKKCEVAIMLDRIKKGKEVKDD